MANTTFIQAKTDEDIEKIVNLGTEIWNEHYIKIIDKNQINYMLEKFQSPRALEEQIKIGYEYFIIDFEGQNVGYFGIQTQKDCLFLSKFYIKADCRGKGIGRKSLEFIKEKALLNGLNSIRLTVNKHNSSVEAYKKFGFKTTKDVITEIGNGYVMDDFIMELEI